LIRETGCLIALDRLWGCLAAFGQQKFGGGFFEKTRDCSGVGRGGQGKMWGCLCKVGCGVFRLPWNLFAASDTVAANAFWLCGCKQVLGKWAKIEAA